MEPLQNEEWNALARANVLLKDGQSLRDFQIEKHKSEERSLHNVTNGLWEVSSLAPTTAGAEERKFACNCPIHKSGVPG